MKILNRFTRAVVFNSKHKTVKGTVIAAINSESDQSGADQARQVETKIPPQADAVLFEDPVSNDGINEVFGQIEVGLRLAATVRHRIERVALDEWSMQVGVDIRPADHVDRNDFVFDLEDTADLAFLQVDRTRHTGKLAPAGLIDIVERIGG